MSINDKHNALKDYLASLGSVAVAFSGGVDSTLLLKVAHDVLGDKAVAVTASSVSFPARELEGTKKFCTDNNIKQIITHSDELNIPGFRNNPKNRCYLCKVPIFKYIRGNNLVVFDIIISQLIFI